MKNKILTILPIFLLIVFLSGCTGPKQITTPEGNVTVEGGRGQWCSTGAKITTAGPQGQATFEIKGMTTHNETEVCEADYVSNQGSVIYYFNEKKDYMVMVFKDKSGNVVQEMNLVNGSINPNVNIVNNS